MMTLLAQQASIGSPDRWWLAFVVPAGVVLGALVAGVFALRTTRTTPHDKLETLISALKDWPDDLPGKETVHQSVELTAGLGSALVYGLVQWIIGLDNVVSLVVIATLTVFGALAAFLATMMLVGPTTGGMFSFSAMRLIGIARAQRNSGTRQRR
ncbi:hypothetical protein [Nocardia sp. NPDC051832]|uniref:hypothetical protein n=1 Tax=Nocardia sp. NPDC051832 TaxID=3155673 RepID=UPI003421250D